MTLNEYRQASEIYARLDNKMWSEGQEVLETALHNYMTLNPAVKSIGWEQREFYDHGTFFIVHSGEEMVLLNGDSIYDFDDTLPGKNVLPGQEGLTRQMYADVAGILELFPAMHMKDYYGFDIIVTVTLDDVDIKDC